jgi:hypothetical protein
MKMTTRATSLAKKPPHRHLRNRLDHSTFQKLLSVMGSSFFVAVAQTGMSVSLRLDRQECLYHFFASRALREALSTSAKS